MNVNLLIDAIVRQTTVLIAQLATTAGVRASLANTANQVFVDLVRELKEQGLGNKVIADMFGLSLRTYHHKVARLSESSTDRGHSLWEALLAFVQERKKVSRTDVFARFSRDDELQVRGVLQDLVDSGLVARSGRGDETLFFAASPEDWKLIEGPSAERLEHLLWIATYRHGPISATALASQVPAGADELDAALSKLVKTGRIEKHDAETPVTYSSRNCVIEMGDPSGWEAAVFDHYQAMVTAITTKLRLGRRLARSTDSVGGSTYGFEVWDDHPAREDVLSFLAETRARAVALRERVFSHNTAHPVGKNSIRVLAYVGQTVLGDEIDDDDDDDSVPDGAVQ